MWWDESQARDPGPDCYQEKMFSSVVLRVLRGEKPRFVPRQGRRTRSALVQRLADEDVDRDALAELLLRRLHGLHGRALGVAQDDQRAERVVVDGIRRWRRAGDGDRALRRAPRRLVLELGDQALRDLRPDALRRREALLVAVADRGPQLLGRGGGE